MMRLKVIDFNVAFEMMPNQTSITGPQGKSTYRSPEMTSDFPYSYQTDMWSLGIILYQCLLGKHPLLGKTFDQTENNIIFKKIDWTKIKGNISDIALDFIT